MTIVRSIIHIEFYIKAYEWIQEKVIKKKEKDENSESLISR